MGTNAPPCRPMHWIWNVLQLMTISGSVRRRPWHAGDGTEGPPAAACARLTGGARQLIALCTPEWVVADQDGLNVGCGLINFCYDVDDCSYAYLIYGAAAA